MARKSSTSGQSRLRLSSRNINDLSNSSFSTPRTNAERAYNGAQGASDALRNGNTQYASSARVGTGSRGSSVVLNPQNGSNQGTHRDSNGNLVTSAVTRDIMRERAQGRNWRGDVARASRFH